MTSGNTLAPPVVRRAPRHAERLPDDLPPAKRRKNLIDGHADEFDSDPVHKQDDSNGNNGNPRGQNTLHANPNPLRKNEAAMAEEMLKEIATRLAIIREELKLSQDGMGEYLHIGRSRWLNWERAIYYPSPVIMKRLCEYTGITFDYIYRGVHAGLPRALSVRLAIREQGDDPDDPEFQDVRSSRARRGKQDV